jgi:hypothetical protein
MMIRLFLLSIFIIVSPFVAAADIDEGEAAYLDLVYGHCFVSVAGKAIVGTPVQIDETWTNIVDYEGSEASMNEDKSAVDLRAKNVSGVDMLVDLKNTEICWTQAAGGDAATLSARLRLHAIDASYGGRVLETKLEQSESGNLSRITIIGLNDWDPVKMPVIVIREVLSAPVPALTTQVMMGTKQVNE